MTFKNPDIKNNTYFSRTNIKRQMKFRSEDNTRHVHKGPNTLQQQAQWRICRPVNKKLHRHQTRSGPVIEDFFLQIAGYE
jgi:hypothetical protein